MVPPGEGDFLVATAADQVPVNAAVLRQGATIIDPSHIDESKLRNKKSLNVALLGVLSRHLQFSEQEWLAAIRRILPEALHEANVQAFQMGRGA
jgi:indolepyruvate ferredoxin oxidoreductase beta subunit